MNHNLFYCFDKSNKTQGRALLGVISFIALLTIFTQQINQIVVSKLKAVNSMAHNATIEDLRSMIRSNIHCAHALGNLDPRCTAGTLINVDGYEYTAGPPNGLTSPNEANWINTKIISSSGNTVIGAYNLRAICINTGSTPPVNFTVEFRAAGTTNPWSRLFSDTNLPCSWLPNQHQNLLRLWYP